MAKCDVCGKGAHFGNNVSHSHIKGGYMHENNDEYTSGQYLYR